MGFDTPGGAEIERAGGAPPSGSWWTEGNRKLIMVSLALVIFGGATITWMIVQPPGVALSDLVTWVGGVLSGLATLGVGGNLAEHKLKAGGR